MDVFNLIRSFFGLGSSEDSEGTEVSVEYDPDEESADSTAIETEEAVAAGTDAAASTDSMTQPSGDPETAAEPAEATGPVPDEPEAEVETETEAETEGPVDDDAEPVEAIRGIGPAYAERLAEADIETVDQLLEADVEDLAERTDLSEKRIRRWRDNASGD